MTLKYIIPTDSLANWNWIISHGISSYGISSHGILSHGTFSHGILVMRYSAMEYYIIYLIYNNAYK